MDTERRELRERFHTFPDSSGVTFWKIFWILGRPFEDDRGDFGRSRRRGWIREGRVRLRFDPRGPRVIREPFWELGITFLNSTHPPRV